MKERIEQRKERKIYLLKKEIVKTFPAAQWVAKRFCRYDKVGNSH